MQRRYSIATIAIFALLVLSIILAQVYRQPLLSLLGISEDTTQITPPACDLNQAPCLLPLITPVASEAPWQFSIAPRPIPVSAPLTLTLTPPTPTLASNRPNAVWVDLTGDTMDMGLIRVALNPLPDGRWEGTSSIPVCVTGRMRWRARLVIQLEQIRLQSDWTFEAPISGKLHPEKSQ